MPTQWIDFKELRDRLDFRRVLAFYKVDVKPSGDQHHGFCPLPGHQGEKKSPSFSANLGRKIFQCFGCRAKGNILDFALLMEGLNPENSADVRRIALKLDGEFPLGSGEPTTPNSPSKPPERRSEPRGAEGNGPVINAPLDFELKNLDPDHPYLSKRGLLPETVAWFGLGFCAKGLMQDRIAIPLHDAAGNLIGYAGRLVEDEALSAENPRYKLPGSREKGGVQHQFEKSRFLYNGHRLTAPVDDLIIVEGFPSVWWLHQCGFSDVVALMGASCSESQAGLVEQLVEKTGRVWILPDGDEGGRRCAESVLPLLASRRFCRWVKLSDGVQPTDLNQDALASIFRP